MEVVELVGGTGRRVVEGVASTGARDANRNILDPLGCCAKLPVRLLIEHDQAREIGRVTYLRRSPRCIYIRAAIFSTDAAEAAWSRIVAGELRGLSVGARDCHIAAAGTVITQWNLGEVSITAVPANRDTTLRIFGGA